MPRRFASLVALPVFALLTVATAPAPDKPGEAPADVPTDVYVAMTTDKGTITLDLDAGHAPLTVANFLKYVDARRLDGTTFYRAMHLDWGKQPNGLLQGGIQSNPRLTFPPVAHEPTNMTGIHHKRGTISMARYAPGTAQADFSIMLADQPGLDAKPDATDPEARAGFAAFGHLVSGMDVVEAIWNAPRSQTKGEGVMKGQMLESPVKILRVRRVAAPPPETATSPAEAPSPDERAPAPASGT